jgi:hypothetical protein
VRERGRGQEQLGVTELVAPAAELLDRDAWARGSLGLELCALGRGVVGGQPLSERDARDHDERERQCDGSHPANHTACAP